MLLSLDQVEGAYTRFQGQARKFFYRALITLRKRHGRLVSPTGSGKTRMAGEIAYDGIASGRFQKVLFLTPKDTVCPSFVGSVNREAVKHGKSFKTEVLGDPFAGSKVDEVVGFLKGDLSSVAPAVGATTIQAFAHKDVVKKLIAAGGGCNPACSFLLIVDEAHHIPDSKASVPPTWHKALRDIEIYLGRERLTTLQVTATDFRGDALTLKDSEEPQSLWIRPLLEHTLDGLAPEIWGFESVPEDSDPVQMCLSARSRGHRHMVLKIVSGSSSSLLVQRLRDAGLVTYDATDDEGSSTGKSSFDPEEYGQVLKRHEEVQRLQKAGNFLEAEALKATIPNVIVVKRRLNEGDDWPLCSAFLDMEPSGSMCVMMQRLGRALRLKIGLGDFVDPVVFDQILYMGWEKKDDLEVYATMAALSALSFILKVEAKVDRGTPGGGTREPRQPRRSLLTSEDLGTIGAAAKALDSFLGENMGSKTPEERLQIIAEHENQIVERIRPKAWQTILDQDLLNPETLEDRGWDVAPSEEELEDKIRTYFRVCLSRTPRMGDPELPEDIRQALREVMATAEVSQSNGRRVFKTDAAFRRKLYESSFAKLDPSRVSDVDVLLWGGQADNPKQVGPSRLKIPLPGGSFKTSEGESGILYTDWLKKRFPYNHKTVKYGKFRAFLMDGSKCGARSCPWRPGVQYMHPTAKGFVSEFVRIPVKDAKGNVVDLPLYWGIKGSKKFLDFRRMADEGFERSSGVDAIIQRVRSDRALQKQLVPLAELQVAGLDVLDGLVTYGHFD